jgi:predicted phage-related endonuclease
MILGNYFERPILRLFSDQTGRRAKANSKSRQHPRYPWLSATPDGLCDDELAGVEIKMVSIDQSHLWANGVPAHVEIQCRVGMAVWDRSRWYVVAFIGGNELRIYTLERDLDFEEAIIEELRRFYEPYIAGNEEPPIEASREADAWLKRHFPAHTEPLRAADEAEVALLDEYAQVRQEHEIKTKERKDLETKLKRAIGDSEGLEWPNGKITYKQAKGTEITEWQKLGRKLMDGFSEDEQKSLIGQHTSIRPGSRRIRFTSRYPTEEGNGTDEDS